MSTRSEIIIKDYGQEYNFKVKLYHHHDGYPSGVGKFLIEQVLPKLLRTNSESCDTIANFLIKHPDDNEFEITVYKHVDIEYQYVIDIPKKEIKCYHGSYGSWDNPRTRFTGKECDLTQFLPITQKEFYS